MIHNLLDSPCFFCGYCASNYYQSDTHKPDCPWYSVGGLKKREEQVRSAIKGVIAERDKLKAALEQVEWQASGAHFHCLWCHNIKSLGHAPTCARQAALAPKEREESEVKHG
jgi:hypothetical protein